MESNPSRHSASTLVDTKMHKEDQQATGGPTSLEVTSEERAYPQLSSEASSTIKLEDLEKIVSQVQPSFNDLDLPKDDLVIIVDESDKDEPNVETEDTLIARSSSPNSLPTELEDLPFKFNELTKEIKGLKIQELIEEFISLPAKVKLAEAKLKTLDALPCLLLNVIKALNKFAKIGTRIDYLHSTEAVLGINLDIPLSMQDPLDKLNNLANKKRKHVDDIHDYFKANKRLKLLAQYEDHSPGTVLNEPILGDLGNSTSNVLIPLDSWTSGLLVYKLPLSEDSEEEPIEEEPFEGPKEEG
nr:hypothetical protein [Tanacetum cinerariifolium]